MVDRDRIHVPCCLKIRARMHLKGIKTLASAKKKRFAHTCRAQGIKEEKRSMRLSTEFYCFENIKRENKYAIHVVESASTSSHRS